MKDHIKELLSQDKKREALRVVAVFSLIMVISWLSWKVLETIDLCKSVKLKISPS